MVGSSAYIFAKKSQPKSEKKLNRHYNHHVTDENQTMLPD
jgi:hypothetical protein